VADSVLGICIQLISNQNNFKFLLRSTKLFWWCKLWADVMSR